VCLLKLAALYAVGKHDFYLEIDVASHRGCHRHPKCPDPCANGPGALAIGPTNRSMKRSAACGFSSVTTTSTKP